MNTPLPGDVSEAAVELLQRADGSEDRMALYLSFRACFFSAGESCKKSGVSMKQVEMWRSEGGLFLELDILHVSDFQRQFHRVALSMNFIRNLRMVLQRDMEILNRALDPEAELDKHEYTYLNKMRGTYTPENLAKLTGKGEEKVIVNFAELVLQINEGKLIETSKIEDSIEPDWQLLGGSGDSSN